MANENFGLSFTTAEIANWNDDQEGKVGEASSIFADIVSSPKLGEAGTIFADIVIQEKVGEAASIDAALLCLVSILGPPGTSTLSGPPVNIATCP